MQPHCARLVVAGRRRDRDDPHALRARETVKRRSGPPSHGPPSPRRGTASPPPTHPVYTAAPSVEGSATTIIAPNRGQGLFSEAADRRAIRLPWAILPAQRCWSPVRSSSARRIGYPLVAFPPPNVDLMRKSALEVIGTIRLT